MKTDSQMSNLAEGHSGPQTASLQLKGISAHSLMFTLETESAQMLCWCPQTNKQRVKRVQTNKTAVHTQTTEAKEVFQDCHSNSKWVYTEP